MPDHAVAPAGRGRLTVESLKRALQRALQERGLEGELKGWDAVREWARVVGPRIAAHSRATTFQSGVLVVEVDGSAWMHELGVLKRQLIRSMNRELGSPTVREVRYVVPRGGILR